MSKIKRLSAAYRLGFPRWFISRQRMHVGMASAARKWPYQYPSDIYLRMLGNEGPNAGDFEEPEETRWRTDADVMPF